VNLQWTKWKVKRNKGRQGQVAFHLSEEEATAVAFLENETDSRNSSAIPEELEMSVTWTLTRGNFGDLTISSLIKYNGPPRLLNYDLLDGTVKDDLGNNFAKINKPNPELIRQFYATLVEDKLPPIIAYPEVTSLDYTRLSVSQDILFRYNLPMRNWG
jgi:hypothetical protein